MTRHLCGAAIASAFLFLFVLPAALPACTRAPEGPPKQNPRPGDTTVREDMKDVAKAGEKAAKDLGHATAEAADSAGKRLTEATRKAGAGSKDAWITTKVKSELTSHGFDPLHVHVDTDANVVTLSGTVDSAGQRDKAVALARGVQDVASVVDHLFVGVARK